MSEYYPVSILCLIAKVSRSTYYASLTPQCTNNQDDILVKEVFFANNEKVGSRQIVLILKEQYGVIMNRKKVIRLMNKNNLICKIRRKQKNNQRLSNEQYIKENILNREFNQQKPMNTACTDITYLYYNNKVCYLCAYIDAKTGVILAHKLSKELARTFVLDCTRDLLEKYSDIEILHSDRGPQYTSQDFQDLTQEYKVVHSMSRPGNPLDNAVMESFWGHLKDYLDLKHCKTFEDAIDLVNKYVLIYNNRPQWNKNKLSPCRYRDFLLAA